jgi:hypothetical protein
MSLAAAGIVGFSACDDILTDEERGEKASAEFCDCLKKNSLSDCEDELNRNYTISTEFIEAFNKANDCDVTISKK